MTLVFGQRMVRSSDGMKGIVAQDGPDLRIMYVDRGEERLASKTERWDPDELVPGSMRHEEKLRIAHYADRALRAYERNEPLKFWEKPDALEVYDIDLVRVIVAYLGQRKTRAAG